MSKKTSRIVGVVMLVVAIAFVVFALGHPEMSFPWSNTITCMIYGVYFIAMIIMLVAPFKHSK
jgi:ABC-type transport system involved in cytochrome c biogenesis permease subunit